MFGTALLATAASETKAAVVRVARTSAVWLLVSVFVLIALYFATSSAYLRLAQLYGDVNSGLIVSGIYLCLALAAVLLFIPARAKNQTETKKRVSNETAAVASAAAITAVPFMIRNRAVLKYLVRNRDVAAALALPALIGGGMYLWAKNSPSSFNSAARHIPGIDKDVV